MDFPANYTDDWFMTKKARTWLAITIVVVLLACAGVFAFLTQPNSTRLR